jgi:glycosyltransferase involved in cell wall biosynthesis
MGVPAVAFDTGGIRQWLRNQVSGLLVTPSSGYSGFATALAAILESPMVRARLSAGALAAAREMSVDAHLTSLEQVLRDAAHGTNSTRSALAGR